MTARDERRPRQPAPGRAATLAAQAPFLLWALLHASNGLAQASPALATALRSWLGWPLLAIWGALLVAGVARGLPRWSLPSVGLALGVLAASANGAASVAGVRLPWRVAYPGWLPWPGELMLPLLAAAALLLAVCAALPRLRPLARRWRDDWTQPAFLLYGFTPVALELLDMHPAEVPLSIIGLLALAGGAWAYMRAATGAGRARAMAGALTLMMAVAGAGQVLLADPAWRLRFAPWRTLGTALLSWLVLLGALLAPALLALLPRRAAL